MAEEISEETKKGFDLSSLGMGAWIGIAVATLVIGLLIGAFAIGGGSSGLQPLDKTTLSEEELDTSVASYTYNGETSEITAREVITQNSTLEAAKDEEGSYAVPSADTVLSVARNKIIAAEAEKRGITISDEDITAYAEETLGSSDLESIATSYSMDVDTVKDMLKQSALMNKLRDEVVETSDATAPEAPSEPEVKVPEKTEDENAEGENPEGENPEGENPEGENPEGEENAESDEEALQKAQEEAYAKPTKEYAEYIIKLAGDEWDADKGKWVAEDGPYASALADYKVTKDGASYEAAQAAYYVAYQQYSTTQSDVSSQWTDFVNGLLSNASITLATMVA